MKRRYWIIGFICVAIFISMQSTGDHSQSEPTAKRAAMKDRRASRSQTSIQTKNKTRSTSTSKNTLTLDELAKLKNKKPRRSKKPAAEEEDLSFLSSNEEPEEEEKLSFLDVELPDEILEDPLLELTDALENPELMEEKPKKKKRKKRKRNKDDDEKDKKRDDEDDEPSVPKINPATGLPDDSLDLDPEEQSLASDELQDNDGDEIDDAPPLDFDDFEDVDGLDGLDIASVDGDGDDYHDNQYDDYGHSTFPSDSFFQSDVEDPSGTTTNNDIHSPDASSDTSSSSRLGGFIIGGNGAQDNQNQSSSSNNQNTQNGGLVIIPLPNRDDDDRDRDDDLPQTPTNSRPNPPSLEAINNGFPFEKSQLQHAEMPVIASNFRGDAFAIWRQSTFHEDSESDEVTYSVLAARYIDEEWERPTSLESSSSNAPYSMSQELARSPDISVDRDGNALAVWHQFDGIRTRIWYNYFNASNNSWQGASELASPIIEELEATGDIVYAAFPKVKLNARGDALVAWTVNSGTFEDPELDQPNGNGAIYIREWFRDTRQWSDTHSINFDRGITSGLGIDINDNGEMVVAWLQSESLWIWTYLEGDPQDSIPLDPFYGGVDPIFFMGSNILNPSVDINEHGRAIVAWEANDRALVSIYLPDDNNDYNWVSAPLPFASQAGPSMEPSVAINDHNEVFVVWSQASEPTESFFNDETPPEQKIWFSFGQTPNTFNIESDNNNNSSTIYDLFTPAVVVDTTVSGISDTPEIQSDSEGFAFVSWHTQYDPNAREENVISNELPVHDPDAITNDVWMNAFHVDSGWGTPLKLNENDTSASSPTFTKTGQDDTILTLWQQHTDLDDGGTVYQDVFSRSVEYRLQ